MDTERTVSDFLSQLQKEGYSPHTIKNYQRGLDTFLKKFKGDVTLKNIEAALLPTRSNGSLSHKSKNIVIIPVRRWVAFLNEKHGTAIPVEQIKTERNRNGRKKLDLPEKEEVRAYLSFRDTPLSDVVVNLLFDTGLRLSELMALKVGDVRERFSMVGKGNKQRPVYCTAKVVALVNVYVKTNKLEQGQPLFPYSNRWIQQLLEERQVRSGVRKNITAHTLRHLYAVNMLQNGASLRAIQELLGHSSILTTQIYTTVTDQHLDQTYKQFHKR